VTSKLSGIIRDLIDLYNWWSGVMFALQFLVFVAYLTSNYVPTPENAITYLLTIIGFSAIEGFVIETVINVAKGIFR